MSERERKKALQQLNTQNIKETTTNENNCRHVNVEA